MMFALLVGPSQLEGDEILHHLELDCGPSNLCKNKERPDKITFSSLKFYDYESYRNKMNLEIKD